jgi:hypothetical protein
MYDEDEPHDYGFDLPDSRHSYVAKDGDVVEVVIRRHWYQDEDENTRYKISFDIVKGRNVVMVLPIGTDESAAIDVAHRLFSVDRQATREHRETEAMYAAERRMGA